MRKLVVLVLVALGVLLLIPAVSLPFLTTSAFGATRTSRKLAAIEASGLAWCGRFRWPR